LSSEEVSETAVNGLRERLPEQARDDVLRVLSVLFPSQSKWFEGKNALSGEAYAELMTRRGIGSKAGYDAYFGLHPSSDAIPKAVIDGIMGNLRDEEALVKALEQFVNSKDKRGQPIIGQLLEELRFRFQSRDQAASPTQEMLDALFRIGEAIFGLEWWRVNVFALSPRSHITSLVEELLKLWGPEEAGKHLRGAFEKSGSPVFDAGIFVDRARELGVIGSETSSSPSIMVEDLKVIGEKLLPRIEQAAEDGTLSSAPFFWDIALSWKYLGDAGKAKAWISAGMEGSAEFLAKVTMGMVSYSLSGSERTYSMSERPDEDLYDLSTLLAACKKHLAGPDLNQDQRNRVIAVERAVEQMLAKNVSP